jgi:amino acid permease
MLLRYYPLELFTCILLGFLIVLAIAVYAYDVDSRRPANDPKKRNYHPFAIFLVPVLLPLILPLVVVIFIGTVLLYAGFLLLFAFLLLTLRKPFLFQWLHKFAVFVGDPLLRLNSYLIRLPFKLLYPNPQQQSVGNLRPVQPM